MNDVTNDPRTALQTTQQANAPALFDFMPRNLTEALELAKVLAESTMVPKDYINKPGNVIIAIQFGAEVGLKPFGAMQSIAVINGKPGLYGDAGKAILIANGCTIIEQDIREIEKQGFASCTVKRAGYPDVTRTFGIDDAKRAKLWNKDGPWTTYPFRQMAWRAFWWAARDAAPDILKGMQGAEELRDTPRDITAESTEIERTPATSRTEALKDRLKKKASDIAEVVAAFDRAKDADDLAKAVALAQGLEGEPDRDAANNAYHRAKERLKAANGGPSDDDVINGLKTAATADDVMLVVDSLRPIAEKDPPRYELLLARCRARETELSA